VKEFLKIEVGLSLAGQELQNELLSKNSKATA
jgi:hypothetical protein